MEADGTCLEDSGLIFMLLKHQASIKSLNELCPEFVIVSSTRKYLYFPQLQKVADPGGLTSEGFPVGSVHTGQ